MRFPAGTRKRPLGLTLVEMLVAIGICMVLAALLVPLVIVAREKARTVVCADNLRGIGVAFSTILPMQNGYFTGCYYDVTPVRDGVWWVGMRDPWDRPDPLFQDETAPVFMCPSARGYVRALSSTGEPHNAPTTYMYNVEMPIIARNVARVPEPINRVIFCDGDPAAVVGEWQHTRSWPDRTIVPRHRGQANFLFLDGHVETRGAFDAQPFHGCPWGVTTPRRGPTAGLDEAPEILGPSNWVLQALVDIHPESNNVKNRGNQVQCTIRIPGPVNTSIDLNTVYLIGAAGKPFRRPLQAEWPMHVQRLGNGALLCQAKFDRQDLYEELRAGNFFGKEVPMKVVGQFADGRPFEGVDENCVFEPPRQKGNPPTKGKKK